MQLMLACRPRRVRNSRKIARLFHPFSVSHQDREDLEEDLERLDRDDQSRIARLRRESTIAMIGGEGNSSLGGSVSQLHVVRNVVSGLVRSSAGEIMSGEGTRIYLMTDRSARLPMSRCRTPGSRERGAYCYVDDAVTSTEE